MGSCESSVWGEFGVSLRCVFAVESSPWAQHSGLRSSGTTLNQMVLLAVPATFEGDPVEVPPCTELAFDDNNQQATPAELEDGDTLAMETQDDLRWVLGLARRTGLCTNGCR